MDKQSIENNLNNEQEIPKYWVDRLSDENKILEKKYSKTHSANIAQPTHIVNIADFNEAIRKFASSFLLPKTDVSFYRMMLTYLGTPIGIDIRMSNHPAGKDENWLLTEGNGLANQRLSIYFRGDTNAISKDCDDGVPLIEQGFHYEHLKNEQVLNEIRKSIVGFIKNGSYAEIKQPFIESDADVAERLRKKEIEKNNRKIQRKFAGISPEDVQSTDNNKTDKNESIQMNHKNTIRITESELKSVIAESVKRILQEEYDVSEGKLGRALGTLALGGALAFGGNNIKAQDMNQPQSVQMHQQNVEGFTFYAPQFKADYEKLLSYTNSKGYQNHDRECAKDMLADFPLDRNGSIHLEYIITCDSGYDMEKIMETSYDWFNYAFSSAEASVSKYDTQNGIITARGSYANIGQFNLNAVYYAKVVRVGADTDVILRFKDNKIKIDVMIRNYRMISGESTMRSNNSLVNVADVYPANPNSDNKVAYARAFINSYSYSMDKVKKYIEFLNDNMNNEITNDDAAWEISDRSSKGAKDMWDFNTPETMKQKYFDIQKQIQANKKAMRSMEKNSEQQLAMKQKNDELRAEMQRLNQEYLKMTGQQIMQFEHPY